MKQGWEIKKLGEVIEIRNGKNQQAVLSETGKYKILGSAGNIMGYATDFICEAGTTIIGRKGNISKPIYIDERFWNVDTAFGFYPKNENEIDKRLIYYLCLGIDFESMNRGTTIPSLVKSELQTIQINYPKSLSEQQRIVATLDEAFASIAKAKANAEQNLKNAKELFESYLQGVFVNKGEGWEEKRFEELCDLITCGVAATPKYVDESVGVPFLSAQNVRDGEVVLDKYRYISKQFHNELTKKNKPSKGDILYSRVGSKFGEAGVVEHDFEFSVYVSLTLIKPKQDRLNSYFLKYYLNSPLIKDLAKKSISSSGVPNLNVKEVREFPIKCPSISLQKKIVNEIEIVSVETKKLEAIYQAKINDLEELKKSVLQKAFNGELKTAKALV